MTAGRRHLLVGAEVEAWPKVLVKGFEEIHEGLFHLRMRG